MTEVSVVIPAYNPGPWLAEALESVRRQTFTDWEVVVVDDDSTEDLTWVSDVDTNVRLVRQAHGGASVARNRGVLVSAGSLIAFMDQDDLWTVDKLAHQVAALAAYPSAGMCFCDLEVFRATADADLTGSDKGEPPLVLLLDEGIEQAHRGEPAMSRLQRSLRCFGSAFVVPSTVMVRRDALAATGLLDPWSPFTGDFDFLIRLGSSAPVVRIDSVDVWYRQHTSNFSLQYDLGRRELTGMRERYLRYADAQDDRPLRREVNATLRRPRRLYAWQALDRARLSWKDKDIRSTGYHLARAAAFDPRVALSAVGIGPKRRDDDSPAGAGRSAASDGPDEATA